MMLNEDLSKTKRQDESIQKWIDNKGIGSLALCPRFGKTRIGLNIISRTVLKNQERKILLLTPSEYITDYWKEQSSSYNIGNTIIISIDMYIKQRDIIGSDFYLMVIDEAHKFTSDVRYSVIKDLCSIPYRLLLFGIKPQKKERDMLEAIAPIIDEVSMEEAIANNWVAPLTHYHIPLQFRDEDKMRYIRFSAKMAEISDVFKGIDKSFRLNGTKIYNSTLEVILSCFIGMKLPHGFIPGEYFRDKISEHMGWHRNLDLNTDYGKQREQYWNPTHIYENAKAYKGYMKLRNEIITNNTTKYEKVIEIIRKFDVPTIVFNESNEATSIIADKLGNTAFAYHSSIESRPIWDELNNDWYRYKSGDKQGQPKVFGKAKLKEEAIIGMKSGKYKYLITTRSLDEGLTIENLEQVIITAGSTNPIQHGQRSARGATIDFLNPNKQTKVFNLYFDDIILDSGSILKCRDKTKLLDRQTAEYIKILSLDEIS